MTIRATRADRIKAAVIAVAIEAAVGVMLVSALGYHVPQLHSDDLKLFGVAPPPPPPPPERTPPPKPAPRHPEAPAAPANLRAKATPVVAPTPIVPPIIPPPPVIAARVAETGTAPSAGAADTPGPGTGAGGEGNGFGGGGRGDGDGGGGERETPPRQVAGRLSIRDVPSGLLARGEYKVGVRYRVEADGYVSRCWITEPSGEPQLDDLTCRLIEQRFRYRPALDADRQPVASTVVDDQYFDVRSEDER